jgi:hypothetical protein
MKNLLMLIFLASPLWATTYHVTTTGNRANNGLTEGTAWPFQYAVNRDSTGGGSIVAGDSIVIHGGIYSGLFYVDLSGSAVSPVKILADGSERVRLDGGTNKITSTLRVGYHSNYVWVVGLEVFSSSTDKWSSDVIDQSNPSDLLLPGGITLQASDSDTSYGVKIINCVLHDVTGGIGMGYSFADAELIGCLVYNTGWMGINLAHGIGTYTQNNVSRKRIQQCIFWGGFSKGMQIYGSAYAYVDSITVDQCVSFNASESDTIISESERNLVFGTGGANKGNSDSVLNSHFYRKWALNSPNMGYSAGVNFGYGAGLYKPVIHDNYFTGALANVGVGFENCDSIDFTGNTLWCQEMVYGWNSADYPGNYYARLEDGYPSSGDSIFTYVNPYDTNRCNVVVYNFDNGDSVAVDVSSVYANGDTVSFYNVQAYYDDAPFVGVVASGSVMVPMLNTRWSKVYPTGWFQTDKYPETFPDFGVFIAFKSGEIPSSPDPVIGLLDTLAQFATTSGDTSTEQTFRVWGTDLDGNIVLVAPTPFELSETTGTGFNDTLTLSPTAGTLDTTTVYVRFRPVARLTYNSNIVVSSDSIDDQTISVLGTSMPTLTVTATMSAFTAQKNQSSAGQSWTISGVRMVDSVVITAPTSFEVSKDSSAWSSTVSVNHSGGTIGSTKLYLRYSPTEWGSSGDVDVIISSTDMTTQSITVSGSAVAPRVLLNRNN